MYFMLMVFAGSTCYAHVCEGKTSNMSLFGVVFLSVCKLLSYKVRPLEDNQEQIS